MAQLVARFHGMEEVRGSNPLSSTTCTVCALHLGLPGRPLLKYFATSKSRYRHHTREADVAFYTGIRVKGTV